MKETTIASRRPRASVHALLSRDSVRRPLEVGRQVVVAVGQGAEGSSLFEGVGGGGGEGRRRTGPSTLHLRFEIVNAQACNEAKLFGFAICRRFGQAQGQFVGRVPARCAFAGDRRPGAMSLAMSRAAPGRCRGPAPDGPKPRQVGTHVAAVRQGHVGLGAGFRRIDVVMGVQVVLLDNPVADAVFKIWSKRSASSVSPYARRSFFWSPRRTVPETVLGRGKHDHRALVVLVEHEDTPKRPLRPRTQRQSAFSGCGNEHQEVCGLMGLFEGMGLG